MPGVLYLVCYVIIIDLTGICINYGSFTNFPVFSSAEKGRLCLQVSSLGVYTSSLTSEDYVGLKHTHYGDCLRPVFPEA